MTFHLIEPRLGRVSGGLRYNHAVVAAAGGELTLHALPGAWDAPTPGDVAALQELVGEIDTGVVLDGLVGTNLPAALSGSSRRGPRPIVQLVHSLANDEPTLRRELTCLRAASAVITTSRFTARQLERRRITATIATPGSIPRPQSAGEDGRHLICIGAIESNKNQLFLANVLRRLAIRCGNDTGRAEWRCTFAGPTTDPGYATRLANALADLPDGAVNVVGELDESALASLLHRADLLLLPSHAESFGMVVREAASAGLPAFVTAGTGGEEALLAGRALPLDPAAWTESLHAWLGDHDFRASIQHEAQARRADAVHDWATTADVILNTLKDASRHQRNGRR